MGYLDDPYGRDNVDKAIREFGNDWWEAARKAAPAALTAAANRIARKHDVDPGYILWILLSDRRSWGGFDTSGNLDTAVRLYIENVETSGDIDYTVPPAGAEGRVDRALQELARWAAASFTDTLADTFMASLPDPLTKIRAAIQETENRRISTREARAILLHDFPLRLRDHPHWFRDVASLRLMAKALMS